MPHTTRTMPHFLVAISLTIAVVLTEPRIQANERIRTLGKDSLGESLREFQVRFPKAMCGSTAFAKTKPRNLINLKYTGKFYCYLDDHDSLARISPSPFLNLGVRAVSAIFWKGRLYNLIFDLNVRSIRTVLKSFEEIYGPPVLIGMDDPANPMKMTYLTWVKGDTEMQARLSHSDGEGGQKDSAHLLGPPGVETVCVDLLNSKAFFAARAH